MRAPDLGLVESDEDAASAASIRLEAPAGCPDYLARVIRGVDATGSSPLWVQARLTASGMRPVSNVVDATNYVMLELGQPLHGFDLERLSGPGIVVRYAEEGERLTTLDDVERTLSAEDLLICDLENPVAIAGVMGGATSEVSDATTDILLESAYFTRTGVLRTARRLDLHTEASHRFERGADPEGLDRGAARGAKLIAAWAGGEVLRGVTRAGEAPPRRWVGMRPSRATVLLGYHVSAPDAAAVFDTLAMTHRAAQDLIEVEVPGYRVDVEMEVDLIEEVARMQGYDRIGSTVLSTGRPGGVPGALRVPRPRARGVGARGSARGTAAVIRLRGGPGPHGRRRRHRGGEPAPRRGRVPADAADAGPSARPRLQSVARARTTVAIFEVGTVFRAGDPTEERPKVAVLLNGPAARGWAADGRAARRPGRQGRRGGVDGGRGRRGLGPR